MTWGALVPVAVIAIVVAFVLVSSLYPGDGSSPEDNESVEVALPAPRYSGNVSLEEALLKRRSVRDYGPRPLNLSEASQILWACQGVTSDSGQRTAPSAGGLYPLEVRLVAADVEGLKPGVYRYLPRNHSLAEVREGDARDELYVASLNQTAVRVAPAVIVISGASNRAIERYDKRGERYVCMEAGHASQNVYLQATALGLGTVSIGAFREDEVRVALGMDSREEALYVMPVGPV